MKGKPHNLLGQIAVIVAKEAWKYSDGIVRFAIPADMRQRQPGLLSTANLTFAIYVEVKKDSTPESVSADIAQQLKEKREGLLTKGDDLFKHTGQGVQLLTIVPERGLDIAGNNDLRSSFLYIFHREIIHHSAVDQVISLVIDWREITGYRHAGPDCHRQVS